MEFDELNKAKIPIVTIDKKLEKYRGTVLFPKKMELANKLLSKAKLPKQKEFLKTNEEVYKCKQLSTYQKMS